MQIPLLSPGHYAVFLDDLRLQVRLGVLPEETVPQTVGFSLCVILSRIGPGDGIEDVVDYNHLRDTVLRLTEKRAYGLQETLCEAIIEDLRSHRNVHGAIVETRKLCVYSDAEAVGCRMDSIDEEALR